MKNLKLLLPARLPVGRGALKIELPVVNRWGYDLKVMIRNAAKSLPEYYLPIEISPLVTGMTDNGEPIPIDTLGRWIFGVPGYQGHIIAEGGNRESIIVYLPVDCPPEAVALVRKALDNLTTKR